MRIGQEGNVLHMLTGSLLRKETEFLWGRGEKETEVRMAITDGVRIGGFDGKRKAGQHDIRMFTGRRRASVTGASRFGRSCHVMRK